MANDAEKPAVPDPAASPDASVVPPPPQGASATAAGTSNWQGKRVSNFRILGFLGRGAMGRVFRAEDIRLRRHVALKVFPTIVDQGKRRVRLERFIREARSTAALDHPGIVRVYEADEFKGWYYIAMELVEGGPVGRLIEANGPFDAARACQIGAEVGEALEFAHDHGVIHRDVKPDNVLIARGGRAKLVDFGLAYRSDPNDSFHVVDEAVGTAFYIAPEICKGLGATPLSDQYSLGGTVWALLTGAPPFAGTTREELIKHQVSTPLPKLRTLRPDLPEGLCKAVEKALSKKPEDRYINCEQFAKILRVYTINSPASSGPVAAAAMTAASSGHQPIVAAEPAPAVAPQIPKSASTDKPFDRRIPIYAAAGVGALAVIGLIIWAAGRGGETPSDPGTPTPTVAAAPKGPAATPVAPTPAVVAPPPSAADAPLPPGDRLVYAGFADNTRAKFDYAPAASGSTQGILKESTNTIVRDAERGLVQKLAILDDPAKTTWGTNEQGWFVRHISGQHGRRAENTPRPTKGYVGLWVKTETPGLKVAIAIDNSADKTADRGIPKPIVADGQWRCYEWNLEDNGEWQRWLEGDGIVNDTPDFTLDSIQFWGPNADAVILLDDVSHNADGHVGP